MHFKKNLTFGYNFIIFTKLFVLSILYLNWLMVCLSPRKPEEVMLK